MNQIYMMKKAASALLPFLMIAPFAFAFEQAGCFPEEGGYYDFINGLKWIDFHTEKPVYQAGEEIEINYRLESAMAAPIVEGFTRVQIFYKDPQQDEQLVDEFVADKDIYLKKGDIVREEVRWGIPKYAKAGKYVAKIFLLIGKSFNLGGISFLAYGQREGTGVPGMLTTFTVENTGIQSRIYFDKTVTKINDKNYQFAAPAANIDEGKPVALSSWLVNEGDPKTVEVKLEIYKWDDINSQPLEQYTVSRKISLSKNEKSEIQLGIPASLKPDSYQVRFWARSGEETSLMKLRFSIPGELARMAYVGLSEYPLEAGKEYVAFVCASNAAGSLQASSGGTISAKLVGDDDQVIFEDSSKHIIPKQPTGFQKKFMPAKDVSKATLVVDLKDDAGKIVDSVELDYDLSKFLLPDAKLGLKISEDTFSQGDTLSYIVDYYSGKFPVSGSLLVYVLDQAGNVISIDKNVQMSGRHSGTMKLALKPGQYRVVVRETDQDKKVEADFTVRSIIDVRPSEVKGVDAVIGGDNTPSLAIAMIFIIIAIIVAVVYMKKKRR